jgi:hypothetical protein
MQLLDRLDNRSWLVAGALVVGGVMAALWARGASTDDDGTVCRFIPPAHFAERVDNLDMLHQAMQRRDALPDQIVPQCATTTFASDERMFSVADTQMFACDGKGCQPVALLAANQRVQHCDDGLPQLFLLRSEFVIDKGAGPGGAGQWHQLWCDDVGTQINGTGGTGGSDRRLFACVSSIAEPGSNLTTPPSRLVHRSNHHVDAAQPLETLSR